MRKKIAAANWKMNLTWQSAGDLMNAILKTDHNLKDNQLAIFAVPFPYLRAMHEKVLGKAHTFIAAQNCASTNNGAYTGEVSAEILKSVGIQYVILGHSERREYQAESNQLLTEKVNRCFEHGLIPIFCCGEPLSIRESNNQNNFVEIQLKESLFHLSKEQAAQIIIAYEPIWAIGTGKTATSAQAEEMHAHIRSVLTEKFGLDVANEIPVLYGGSVKGSNAAELFSKPNVDGGLVGGASLNADEFNLIIKSLP
ncbi:MAG: triose-phosphate isomerase [Ferruginibacter sp.]|nr:triose-phosphate isomerase [Ferruginibacter sp.]